MVQRSLRKRSLRKRSLRKRSLRKGKRSIRKGKRSLRKGSLRKGKRSLRKRSSIKRNMYGGYQTQNFHHWITGPLRDSNHEVNIDIFRTYLQVIHGDWNKKIIKENKNIYNLKTVDELYDSFYKYFLKSNKDFSKFMEGYKILLKPTFEEYYNEKNPSSASLYGGMYGGGGFVTLYSWLKKNERENKKSFIQELCKGYLIHIYNNWNNDVVEKNGVKIFTSVDEAYDSFYKFFVKSNSNFMKSFKILLKPIYKIMYFNYIGFENYESININPGIEKNQFIRDKIINEIKELLLFKDYSIEPVNVQPKITLYPANDIDVVDAKKPFPYGVNNFAFPLDNTGEKDEVFEGFKEDEEDEDDEDDEEENEGFYGFEETPTETPKKNSIKSYLGPGEEGGGKRRSKRRITKNSITKNSITKNSITKKRK